MATRATDSADVAEQPPKSDEQSLDPISFYEDESVVAAYQLVRNRMDGPKMAIEEPAVLALLGDLRGCSILDLGCGDARIGREAFQRGAVAYLGLDGSRRMVELARQTLAGTGGEIRLQNLELWNAEEGDQFDVVVSQLALQYIRDLSRIFGVVRKTLKPHGMFVFSVEHPIRTSSYNGEPNPGIADSWCVQGYFHEGSRVDAWLNSAVVKQHRTLQTYIGELLRGGFQIDHFSEGWPDADRFADRAVYERRLEVPVCVIIRARLNR